MRVLGLEPHSDYLLVVLVEHDGSEPVIRYYDNFAVGTGERPAGLAAVRTRVHGLVTTEQPDLVVVKPLEPEALKPANKRNIKLSWFLAAEVRGVALEACHAAGAKTETRDGATVTRTIGARKGKEYVADDAYWAEQVRGTLTNKKYRPVALMAISALRAAES